MCQHLSIIKKIKCPFGNCGILFTNKSTFKCHVHRKHKNTLSTITQNQQNVSSANCNDNAGNTGYVSNGTNCSLMNTENTFSSFFIQLKTKHKITENGVKFVSHNLCHLLEKSNSEIISNIKNYCESSNISQLHEKGILKIIQSCNLVPQIQQFDSNYKLTTHIQNNNKYVKPVTVNLGTDEYHNHCIFHYVPILETIQSLMSDKTFFSLFNLSKEFEHDIYFDYNDGSAYKTNSFLTGPEKRIEILLFQDAFETCSPLASSKKKHKLIGIYMVIGNINRKFRSSIQNIQLVLLCKESHIKRFGFNKILEPVIKDLTILENHGIQILNQNSNEINTYYGSLIAMLGDNLGSHQIGGFLENFSFAEYFCRYCCYTRSMLKEYDFSFCELRNSENYNVNLTNMELFGHDSEKGVKSDSTLNKLKYFHVCNPGLPPCVAHDLWEGIIPFDLMLIINNFISNKYITIDFLNLSLSSLRKQFKLHLSFPKIEKNSKKLPGKSDEIFHVLILFPYIMLGQLTNFEDPIWIFFTAMIDMCRLILAPVISKGQTTLLSHYINVYMECRKQCFPGINLRPKHHYIWHYPELIRAFGPLKNLWTLCFEQKHQEFKNRAKFCKNFKNITLTLSRNHQEAQCRMFEDRFNIFIICNDAQNLTENMFNLNLPNEFSLVTKKMSYMNTNYDEGDYILINADQQKNIQVLIIKAIFLNKSYNKCIFYGNLIKMCYNENLNLYESVATENSYTSISMEDILLIKPLHILKYKNKHFFSPNCAHLIA